MRRLLLLVIVVALLAACGPERARTIEPRAEATETAEPETTELEGTDTDGTDEADAVDPTESATETVEPTGEPTAEPATDEPEPTETPTEEPATETPTEPAQTGEEIDQEALFAALLTLADMPTGWTAKAPEFEERTPGGTYTLFCAERTARSIGRASVEFEKAALGPFLTHTIVVYPDDEAAEAALEDYITAAGECTAYTSEDGTAVTISPLSFPDLGDESFAFRMRYSLDFDVIQMRVGNALVSISHAGLGGTDSALTEEWARVAVERYR